MKKLFLVGCVAIAMALGGAPLEVLAASKETPQKTGQKKTAPQSAQKSGQKKAAQKKTERVAKKESAQKKALQAKKKTPALAKKQADKKLALKERRLKVSQQARAKPRPVALAEDAAGDGELALHSASVLVLDQATGQPIYAKNPDLTTPIASITKLMTAMVVLDANLPMHEEIEIGHEDVDRLKFTSSRLPLGARLTREELLHLALIASENRAAAALSRAYPGGREAFVRAMNEKARQLGMANTHYVDGTGLSSLNRSTASDLARLVDVAYRYYPEIRKISATGSYEVSVPSGKGLRHLSYVNTNALTRNDNWQIGVSKTGYIREAGHCLVMQAQIAGQRVIIVLLDSLGKMSRIGDAARIKRWLEHGGPAKMVVQAERGERG